jgi:flavin reductase (DIM6/NTAB) family NADH-FMN oxidoreductase RutF
MIKTQLPPDTTLYPVPVVLITCGHGKQTNIFTVNRIASCNAEPPMISISVRPGRASHALIEEYREFVVNIPFPEMKLVSDFVGSTTLRETDKWEETGLTPVPAMHVKIPLLTECPVNLECRVIQQVRLPSHSLFIAEVVALHAEKSVLNERGEVDLARAKGGLTYEAAVVRERPVENFRPATLLQMVRVAHQEKQNVAFVKKEND